VGRIVAKGNQPEAVSHPFGIIEMKKRGSGAPTRASTFDTTAVEAKMAIPSLLTRVEEEDDLAPAAGDVRERRVSWPSPHDACCLNCW
jgi:hypothetical protein